MNLKNCVTKQKNYTPHKLRSHPLKCITFPVCLVFIFIVFWFITCPVIFVGLWKQPHTWPKEWPFYFWIVALLIFLILLSILVCVWRCAKQDDLRKTEADLLLNSSLLKKNDSKQKELCMISLNTIQKNQEKFDDAPVPVAKQQNCVANISNLQEKLTKKDPQKGNNIENNKDPVFRRCSLVPKVEKEKRSPQRITLPAAGEIRAEIHSASPPLSPREIFFWDLIECANRSRKSGIYDFIEHEKKYCSVDNSTTPVSEGVHICTPRNNKLSSAEYFIANVPDRKSLTTEIFLYVDGNEEEKHLKIRSNQDVDDDVFAN